jgi:hypothetical protein
MIRVGGNSHKLPALCCRGVQCALHLGHWLPFENSILPCDSRRTGGRANGEQKSRAEQRAADNAFDVQFSSHGAVWLWCHAAEQYCSAKVTDKRQSRFWTLITPDHRPLASPGKPDSQGVAWTGFGARSPLPPAPDRHEKTGGRQSHFVLCRIDMSARRRGEMWSQAGVAGVLGHPFLGKSSWP